MHKTTQTVRRLFLAAGLCAFAASASALSIDPQIMIDRALDSPTLTVKYSGVSAALVELRVNGESLGTRSVTATKAAGETNFTLDMTELKDGDNEIEVRLFDRTGKLVGQEHTTIKAEAIQRGPIVISSPRIGATVQGAVQIQVDLASSLKNSYVSFFVDGNFKSMTNFPPYNYVWDTERESNGWHELEAWAVDSANETHKTRKMRVFVNNPQGRTDRPGVDGTLTTSGNTEEYVLSTPPKGVKHVAISAHAAPSGQSASLQPKVHQVLDLEANTLVAATGAPAGTKPVAPSAAIATGQYHMYPTHRRVAEEIKPATKLEAHAAQAAHEVISITPHKAPVVAAETPHKQTLVASTAVPTHQVTQVAHEVEAASSLITITRGTRIPDLGSFAIALDANFVDFHGVEPRVDDGVPMTPLRYLLEQAGGKVDWENENKEVHAKTTGHDIDLKIGAPQAVVNQAQVPLERPAYLDRGRTIVPLSFIRTTLDVQVQYDKRTGHVLITSTKK